MLKKITVRHSFSTIFVALAILWPSVNDRATEPMQDREAGSEIARCCSRCHWRRCSPNCGPHADFYYYGYDKPVNPYQEGYPVDYPVFPYNSSQSDPYTWDLYAPNNAGLGRYYQYGEHPGFTPHYTPYFSPAYPEGYPAMLEANPDGPGLFESQDSYLPTNTTGRWYFNFPSHMQDGPAPTPSNRENRPDAEKIPDDASGAPIIKKYTVPPKQPPAPPPKAKQEPKSRTYQHPKLQTLMSDDLNRVNAKPDCGPEKEGYTVNFEDISVIQLIQFISKISGTNYIFDSRDLQFNISIVSEDETSVTDLSAALLQILKMHGLSVVEQGNNVLVYRDQNMSKVSTVITDDNINASCDQAIITRVFRLFNVDVERVAQIVKALISPQATVEASVQTRHLVVTDITANVNKIADLINALDTPNVTIDVTEYEVERADAQDLAAYARQILDPFTEGSTLNIIANADSKKIFIVGNPFLIQKALQILESLDVPDITPEISKPLLPDQPPLLASTHIENNNFYMYKLKYQSGDVIAEALRRIGLNLQYAGVANIEFVNTIYSLEWIPVNNSLIITGTDPVIEKVVELLDDLDQAPKQVYVEVLILDTTLQNSLDFGVQWIALGDDQNKLAYASGLLSNAPPAPNLQGTATTTPGARYIAANPAAGPPTIPNPGRDVALPTPSQLNGLVDSDFTSAFGFGIIGNILRHNGQSFLTLGALVTALDEEADTTIVLNPRVMVEDTQTANFFVGQNIPFQTTSTVIQQTGSVTQNIQYEDVGVQLRVTPTIAPNNVVTLQIDQTVAELTTAVGNLTPTTNKTLATTRVHVPDGTFLVMSGHIRDRCDYIRSGIPCLGTLPLIGPTFSRTIEQRTKRNLIFFIRPKVITTIQEGLDLTNQEGYDYNWESNPCSIIDCEMKAAPECEVYPPPCPCP